MTIIYRSFSPKDWPLPPMSPRVSTVWLARQLPCFAQQLSCSIQSFFIIFYEKINQWWTKWQLWSCATFWKGKNGKIERQFPLRGWKRMGGSHHPRRGTDILQKAYPPTTWRFCWSPKISSNKDWKKSTTSNPRCILTFSHCMISSCLVSAICYSCSSCHCKLAVGSWHVIHVFLQHGMSNVHTDWPLTTEHWATYATTTSPLVVRPLVVSNSNISLVIAKVLHCNIELETWRFAQNLGWWHKILLSAVCPWQQVHFQGQTREDWAAAFRRNWHLNSW